MGKLTPYLLLLLGFPGLLPLLPAQQPVFRATTPLVQVPVTVADPKGQFVSTLQESDFQLRDNGILQKFRLEPEDSPRPVALVVVVQTSDVADSVLKKIRKLGSLLQPLLAGEGGRIATISCHEKVEELLPFTTDETEVVQAINKLPVHPGRQSHWVDGIAAAAAMLDARPPLERRAILLISESRDRGSQTPLVDVIKRLQHRAITLHSASFSAYWTAFTVKGNEYRPAAGGGYLDAIVELSRLGKVNAAQILAEQSGGRQLSFVRLSGLEQLLMQVGQELHRQYLLTYSPAGFSPGAHQIQVTVPGHPEFALRHRPQYWLDAPEPPQ